ncbi:hypothetical protein BSG1_17266 [Bacillus sp. SG-1]|nr:hypothetical protein BSG1_17266 [Bacillus sp. SG-1]
MSMDLFLIFPVLIKARKVVLLATLYSISAISQKEVELFLLFNSLF